MREGEGGMFAGGGGYWGFGFGRVSNGGLDSVGDVSFG